MRWCKILVTCLFKEIQESILISKKFGLYLSNPDEENIEWIKEQVYEELHNRNYAVNKHNSQAIQNYDLDAIINSPYYIDTFTDYEMEYDAVWHIAKKVICIYNDECRYSLLHKINPYIDNPTCERTIESKFISFINELDRASNKYNKTIYIHIGQDDYISFCDRSRLISFMHSKTKSNIISERYQFENHEIEVNSKVKSILENGAKIDNYISSEKDFFIINYLIDSLTVVNDINASGIVKLFSLIELLLLNDNDSIHNQIKDKLPLFLPDYLELSNEEKIQKASRLYKIRNKIAHGDYMQLKRELTKYKKQFMTGYDFDLYEFSEDNWIITGVYITLKDCVFKIIDEMLKDKQKILNIKLSNN